jgi:lysyl endopeptidase
MKFFAMLAACVASTLVFAPNALSAGAPRVQASPVPNVRLDPLGSEDFARELASGGGSGVARQVGVGRVVMALRSGDAVLSRLAWEALPEGDHVAAFSVTSPGATALRVGLRINSLPRDTILRFYGPASRFASEVTNDEVRATFMRNMEDDDDLVEDTRIYWSPVIGGDTVVLEIDIPAGADMQDVQVAVPAVSHLAAAAEEAGSPATRMIFTRGGSSFLCPAAHVAGNACVSSQTEASTLQRY